jgi:hypothetical protein
VWHLEPSVKWQGRDDLLELEGSTVSDIHDLVRELPGVLEGVLGTVEQVATMLQPGATTRGSTAFDGTPRRR